MFTERSLAVGATGRLSICAARADMVVGEAKRGIVSGVMGCSGGTRRGVNGTRWRSEPRERGSRRAYPRAASGGGSSAPQGEDLRPRAPLPILRGKLSSQPPRWRARVREVLAFTRGSRLEEIARRKSCTDHSCARRSVPLVLDRDANAIDEAIAPLPRGLRVVLDRSSARQHGAARPRSSDRACGVGMFAFEGTPSAASRQSLQPSAIAVMLGAESSTIRRAFQSRRLDTSTALEEAKRAARRRPPPLAAASSTPGGAGGIGRAKAARVLADGPRSARRNRRVRRRADHATCAELRASAAESLATSPRGLRGRVVHGHVLAYGASTSGLERGLASSARSPSHPRGMAETHDVLTMATSGEPRGVRVSRAGHRRSIVFVASKNAWSTPAPRAYTPQGAESNGAVARHSKARRTHSLTREPRWVLQVA